MAILDWFRPLVHIRVSETPCSMQQNLLIAALVIARVAIVLICGEVRRTRTSPGEDHVLARAVPASSQLRVSKVHISGQLEEHADAATEVGTGSNGRPAELVESSAIGKFGDEILTHTLKVAVAVGAGFTSRSGDGDVIGVVLRSRAYEDGDIGEGDEGSDELHRDC